ncbi:uracil-DNA glycosylase-like protein [Dactylonectria macrodidyma]|uniref:Uracil-DNA glycosylase-like protein n=1 Tax=Dactylonectria macrodidyma TaxID=307937 RepID=A0A9P9F978_9HYPO|nr:uracil-DNA glycosylase-like protein [Dactylonectria macrodidyma]
MATHHKEESGHVGQSDDETGQGEPQSLPQPATFNGRLQLSDFAFKSSSSGLAPESATPVPTRRSPRFNLTSSSTSSSKRPQQDDDNDGKANKTKKKRARTASGYAPPSTYAHLPLLPDAIAEDLLVLFIGLNPGVQTARTGHAYAHPSNLFWKLLFSSGVTPRLCSATEDRQMPELYSLGLTNIVARPSRNGAELSKQEMDEGVEILEEKARKWRPESICVVGKSIWESVWRVRHGRPVGKAFKYGWQDTTENMGVIDGEWDGARVFVASSTSGLAATLSPAEKQSIWAQLGSWVKIRRVERETDAEKTAPGS